MALGRLRVHQYLLYSVFEINSSCGRGGHADAGGVVVGPAGGILHKRRPTRLSHVSIVLVLIGTVLAAGLFRLPSRCRCGAYSWRFWRRVLRLHNSIYRDAGE